MQTQTCKHKDTKKAVEIRSLQTLTTHHAEYHFPTAASSWRRVVREGVKRADHGIQLPVEM